MDAKLASRPEVLASSSSSSRRSREVAPKSSPTEPTDRLVPGMDVAGSYSIFQVLSTARLTSEPKKRTRRPALWTQRSRRGRFW